MRAGSLKYRLRLLKPVYADTDGFGAKPTVWTPTVTIHAERVKASGRRTLELGEQFADYHVEFNIRDAHKVRENWKVEELGGYVYNVVNVIPNRDRGMLTLICERDNE